MKMAVTQKHSRPCGDALSRDLKEWKKFTLIEAQLETGRTHQIRVHMTYIGHPLLGDMVYGPKKQPIHLEGQALHAVCWALLPAAQGNIWNLRHLCRLILKHCWNDCGNK